MNSKKVFKYFACIILILLLSSFLGIIIYTTNIDYIDLDFKYLDSIGKKTEVFANDGKQIEFNGLDGTAVKLEELPPYLPYAFIAIEDKRFYKHNGFDYVRIMGALIDNLKSFSIKEGASTISQQLVKNTHLSNERTIERKLKEMHITRQLENRYSKNEILEKYLNVIYFGNGLYGVEAASKAYFNKKAKDLSIAESAALASIINSPAKYNPVTKYNNLIKRQKSVLKYMQKNKFISQEEYNNALQDKVVISNNVKNAELVYSEVALMQAKELVKKMGINRLINCKIFTYYDANIQNNLKNSFEKYIPQAINENGIQPDFGGIIIDNKSIGINGFYASSENVINIKRQPASAIKPLAVYSPALEKDLISPATLVKDEPINYDGYSPKNYNRIHMGWISIREAVKTSNNIAAVKVLNNVEIDYSKNFLKNMGININAQDNGLSIALGGLHNGVTLLQLTESYTALANSGIFNKSSFIKKILSADGEILYLHEPTPVNVMRDDTAYIMTDMLTSTVKDGTAWRLNNHPFQISAKTGTTGFGNTEKNNDAYCISYNSLHTLGVWLGNISNTEKTAMSKNVTGGTYSTMISSSIYDNIYSDITPTDFIRPNSVVYADIDLKEYNENKSLILASSSVLPRYRRRELFSVRNIPPKAVNIQWEYAPKIKSIEKKQKNFLERMIEIFKKKIKN